MANKPDKIILHCSATREGRNYTVEDIDRWHRERGFKMIGYHYVIYLDGSIHKGRPEEMTGAHTVGENSRSIGICYIGGLDKDGRVKDTRTEEQKVAMTHLVKDILDRYHLDVKDVHLHREYANKACPCFSVEDFVADYNRILNLQ